MIEKQAVMLASPSKGIASTPREAVSTLMQMGWLFDLKWDGVRCMAYVKDGDATLINRNGRNITERYPEVWQALRHAYPHGEVVLDGEIVAFGADGKPDFSRLAKRDRATTTEGTLRAIRGGIVVTFIPFDLLWIDGDDMRGVPYTGRLAVLTDQAERWPAIDGRRVLIHSPATFHGHVMWDFVQAKGVEGLVSKDPAAAYRGGRSPTWVKVKDTKRLTAIVTGYEPGTGRAEGAVGALTLGLLNDRSELIGVGRVGTGFSAEDRAALQQFFDRGGGELLAEVEYQNVTADGVLRFPSFKGIRTDLTRADCTINQMSQG